MVVMMEVNNNDDELGIIVRKRREYMWREIGIIGGLIGVQFVYAGNSVLQGYLMSIGLHPSSLILSSTFATFLVLAPFSFSFERQTWPRDLSSKFIIQLVLISFAGVTLFQTLMLKGINLTSPALATAMPNLAPGLIFLIAWIFRLEKVNLSCVNSRVKILGTTLCVIGAVTMSIMQSSTTNDHNFLINNHDKDEIPTAIHIFPLDRDKIVGSLYLMGAVFVLSGNVVLQAITLGDFPAPISLCAITSLIGVILTILVELIQEHRIDTGWPIWSLEGLICYSIFSGSVSGACVSFNGWALKIKGPVLVSIFNPIGTVITVIISGFVGQEVGTGCLLGMLVMFIGLYFVLWAKGKEAFFKREETILQGDTEKPLLS